VRCAQVLGVAEKRRAALKRKLSALQTSANEKLAEAASKVAKINQQASKLPSLGEWQQARQLSAGKLRLSAVVSCHNTRPGSTQSLHALFGDRAHGWQPCNQIHQLTTVASVHTWHVECCFSS
jgi:hypothetical protein